MRTTKAAARQGYSSLEHHDFGVGHDFKSNIPGPSSADPLITVKSDNLVISRS